jgi:DNA-binding transcriptional ArsR family regulator
VLRPEIFRRSNPQLRGYQTHISQSTASQYLDVLQRCGLLLSERHGKWTYFRRNEEAIAELARFVGGEL